MTSLREVALRRTSIEDIRPPRPRQADYNTLGCFGTAMTTSSTKTKALCVATRCTSVEQFVATFHRFCGDDQTFFVATMTSRPIGLETPFSIQLADKQPVLRGMCVVLDAWPTPENRY